MVRSLRGPGPPARLDGTQLTEHAPARAAPIVVGHTGVTHHPPPGETRSDTQTGPDLARVGCSDQVLAEVPGIGCQHMKPVALADRLRWNQGMTHLAPPDLRYAESWCAAVRESIEAGERHIHGAGLWNLPEEAWRPADLAACRTVVAVLLANNDPAVPRLEGQVPNELLWIVDGEPEELVGFISLRFELDDWLLQKGGHIGYSVRPSRRGQGYASRALTLGLQRLRERGIGDVLVTCNDDNVGSARTIERACGVLEDVREGVRRYWVRSDSPG